MRVPRARGVGLYLVFAAAAGTRGQGGLELWVLRTWLILSNAQLVLHESSRVLIVRLTTIVGIIQVLVAHALDSSYPQDVRHLLSTLLVKGVLTIWLVDTNVTAGSVQSYVSGQYQQYCELP